MQTGWDDTKLLIVDDDQDILVAGKLLLKRHFGEIITCDNPAHIPDLMAQHDFDAFLLDMNFGPGESAGEQGLFWLQKIQKADPNAVVVMITAHGNADVAVKAMKQGATDFVIKPWQNEKIVATLSAAVRLRSSRRETERLAQASQVVSQSAQGPRQEMLGNSASMRAVISLIERAAPTEANVLLLGENGTGKELAARALHDTSPRAGGIFMSIDLGALTESLFESELFGHKKGAFTDAAETRIGKFQAAEGGTLFLDEIGNLPLHLQTKLLTVLEQRKVTPVGANRPTPIDVRIIAATNVSAAKLHDKEFFRQDLLFRLNTVEITLPPLRERPEDIAEIAYYYAKFYCRKYSVPEKRFTAGTLAALTQHSWPGNVRALRHAIERAVVLSARDSDSFSPADFQLAPDIRTAPASPNEEHTDLNLERIESRTIRAALQKHRYNISHTAKELGLTRAALYRRMEKHGI
ncbi:sigma-54-dependent transcriptional regulator [Sphingosinicella soli]|uniref:DNA-binding NtrC family response regulator n=1 Tax=Sphingosinicella soli TaxID=333708 RepID=A0A7W7B065_9SPHN|nr:sigma-54 dependent transcriptional regulator [Sphingosinicella soli]MBB4631587.1 DNA-binding NtrC family response regulator [Sphingosinicella soli]